MLMRYAMLLALALVLLSLPAIGREARVNDTGGDQPQRVFQEEASDIDTSEAARPVYFERIIDADSFAGGGEAITIWGIDAPDHGDDQYLAATLFLETMINQGELVCRGRGTHAESGFIMHCLIDGLDVGSMMVQMGMAAASDNYYGYEQDLAQKEGRGIWRQTVSRSR